MRLHYYLFDQPKQVELLRPHHLPHHLHHHLKQLLILTPHLIIHLIRYLNRHLSLRLHNLLSLHQPEQVVEFLEFHHY